MKSVIRSCAILCVLAVLIGIAFQNCGTYESASSGIEIENQSREPSPRIEDPIDPEFDEQSGPIESLESDRIVDGEMGGGGNQGPPGVQGPLPIQFSPRRLSAGVNSTCVTNSQGRLTCWGPQQTAPLWLADASRPLVVDQPHAFDFLAVRQTHICAIRNDGRLFCWGENTNAQTGLGTSSGRQMTPAEVDTGQRFVHLALATQRGCAITDRGKLKCWGVDGSTGELGPDFMAGSVQPVEIDRVGQYVEVSLARTGGGCAISTQGQLKCWGGVSFISSRAEFRTFNSDNRYRSVAVGGNHACAILQNGIVQCWGSNNRGQLGMGTAISSSTEPRAISGRDRFVQIVVSAEGHSCGITSNQELKCWGNNQFGQVGEIAATRFVHVPTDIRPGVKYSTVSVGDHHTCALTTEQLVECWGSNANGQVGDSSQPVNPTVSSNSWVELRPGSSFKKVEMGDSRICAQNLDNLWLCWGSNLENALGDGTGIDRVAPSPVATSETFAGLSKALANGNLTCGLNGEGQAFCWGSEAASSASGTRILGANDRFQSPRPLRFAFQHVFETLQVGGRMICGLEKGRNTLFCWGSTVADQILAASSRIPANDSFVSLAVGSAHVCSIQKSGKLFCWGANNMGQVGSGETTNFQDPIEPLPGKAFQSVHLNANNSCAIEQSGALSCWGAGTWRMIADGTSGSENRLSPVSIDSGSQYKTVRLGNRIGCGITREDESIKCWGFHVGSSLSPVNWGQASVRYQDLAVNTHTVCVIDAQNKLLCRGSSSTSFSRQGQNTARPITVIQRL